MRVQIQFFKKKHALWSIIRLATKSYPKACTYHLRTISMRILNVLLVLKIVISVGACLWNITSNQKISHNHLKRHQKIGHSKLSTTLKHPSLPQVLILILSISPSQLYLLISSSRRSKGFNSLFLYFITKRLAMASRQLFL